jgi:NAD(P)-dependent dehydrogenase (short-subunit alcohol dehydrogenase family)
MRVLVVGGTGTIGSAISDVLGAAGHDVMRAGRSSGDFTVDVADRHSIRALYRAVGPVDAVVCAAGQAKFGALAELEDADFNLSIASKMMGQVDLVRLGVDRVTPGGSFTLTTGSLSAKPTPGSAAVAMVGAAVEGFVRAAALDLDEHRLNAVSPGWVAESRVAAGLDPLPGIWAEDLAEYYVSVVEGTETGRVLLAEEAMP